MARLGFKSRIITDAGISMGDEGKGRLIYEITEDLKDITGDSTPVAVVMKVNGGANSGHTAGGLKLNLLPAAVIEESIPCLAIGAGVVADPRKFLWEIKPLEAHGYSIRNRLLIDEKTQVSDLNHRLLDLACEHYRIEVLKEPKRGTTARGITPAYADEVGQWQIPFSAFLGCKDSFAEAMKRRVDRSARMIQHVYRVDAHTWNSFFDILTEIEERANAESLESAVFPAEEFDFSRFRGTAPYHLNEKVLIETYWEAGMALKACIGDVRNRILTGLEKGKYVIGEFGQSFWLDKRHGFPPNVTASHTYGPEFFQSAGIPLQSVHMVGACKAYDTKVGTHSFITEIPHEHPLATKLEKLEFGTSTGRQRMVGWFDAVEKGDALRYGGFDDLVINKLDALTYSGDWQGGELLICNGYSDGNGSRFLGVPRDDSVRKRCKPVYLQLPGWSEDISTARSFSQLPVNAQRYVAVCLREIVASAQSGGISECPLPNLRFIGVGPDPDQIIRDIPRVDELLQLAGPTTCHQSP